MSPFDYLRNLFETNRFTLHLLMVFLGASLLKYFRMPKAISPKAVLLIIAVLGLVLRIGWLAFSSHEPKFSWKEPMQENDIINVHAVDLTKGVWFVDNRGEASARRPIGYPLFLGLAYKIFGVSLHVAHAANLLLYLACVFLIFLIGRQLFGGRVGLVGAFLFSIYPVSIYSIALITDEHLLLPIWYFGLYLLLRAVKQTRIAPGLLVGCGLVFGYAAMTRTNVIFMPFVVAIACILLRLSWAKVAAAFVTVLFFMQLINLPWVIRNYKIWGVPVMYTATGYYIYDRLNSYATPEGGGHVPKRGEPGFSEELEKALAESNDGQIHRLSNQLMVRWIVTHPKQFLPLGLSRLILFVGWYRAAGVWPLWFQYAEGCYDPARPLSPPVKEFLQEAAFSFYYGLFFTLLFSLFLVARRWRGFEEGSRRAVWVIASCFFFWFLEHTVIFPERKHRFPLEPLMMPFAAVFWDYILFEFRWGRLKLRPPDRKPGQP